MYWEKVDSVQTLKQLKISELDVYAAEIREHIIATVEKNGGHLSSNLGSIELTLGLHYVFDVPQDKILFDVGHQAYTHKILTGRRDTFDKLRQNDGISGFPKMSESQCDAFTVGHASTSLSAAVGLARARDLQGEKHHVVAVIGDGALTGGLAYEAINDIGEHGDRVIIVLNDNKMSISGNVGALSKYLARLRLSSRYSRFKSDVKRGVSALPFFGDKLVRALDKTKSSVKSALLVNKMFENYGIKYLGPFDGHNVAEVIDILRQVKKETRPVLVHFITNKGKGLYEAECDPTFYHGVSGNAPRVGTDFSTIVSAKLPALAEKDRRVVAITAAMADGTGLAAFAKRFPERYHDVGIAEEHAVTMAAGLAAGGCKPYFAVYSSFLQRAFDEILHDVCINRLPVTFLVDRAGAVGADGVTHQGVFDLSYLSLLPDMTVLAPKDGEELSKMLEWSLTFDAPLAIRYPKSFKTEYAPAEGLFDPRGWELCRKADNADYVLAVGNRMLDEAMQTNANVVNVRAVKPLDTAFLDECIRMGGRIVTLEDNVLKGGLGEAVAVYVAGRIPVRTLGYPDAFIDNRSVRDTLEQYGLTAENIRKILQRH